MMDETTRTVLTEARDAVLVYFPGARLEPWEKITNSLQLAVAKINLLLDGRNPNEAWQRT